MAKNNIRSFRYSDRVAEILEAQKGNTLNEKFENLVLYCFDRVPWVEKRLQDVEKEIDQKRQMLSDCHRQIDQINYMIRELENMKKDVETVSRRAKAIAEAEL